MNKVLLIIQFLIISISLNAQFNNNASSYVIPSIHYYGESTNDWSNYQYGYAIVHNERINLTIQLEGENPIHGVLYIQSSRVTKHMSILMLVAYYEWHTNNNGVLNVVITQNNQTDELTVDIESKEISLTLYKYE